MPSQSFYGVLVQELTRARVLSGRSQAVVSESLGVTQGTFSNWEVFRTIPSADNLIQWFLLIGLTGHGARRLNRLALEHGFVLVPSPAPPLGREGEE